jgi:hypothetical protein
VQGGKIIQDFIGGNISLQECILQPDEDRINTLRSLPGKDTTNLWTEGRSILFIWRFLKPVMASSTKSPEP